MVKDVLDPWVVEQSGNGVDDLGVGCSPTAFQLVGDDADAPQKGAIGDGGGLLES
jgi:hypothetical protein